MNNNKKYKKWSLGLVAPALVLAPIAVVASCSSSGEEKEAYGIEFKATQIRAKIHNATQPNDLTDEQFKEEVLNHLDELFTVTGKLPADDFISKNIEIGELQKNNDKKEVSAKVKVNNANTDGKSIEETITLTGLGYEEVDLTKLVYTIALKENNADPQKIELSDQANNSTDTINAEKLMELVLVDATKEKILEVSGDNADQITNEILANQILKISGLNTDKAEGEVTFKLSIEKPVNGAGNTLEKTITFTGFKKETDSTPPASPKYKITLKTTTPEKEYQFTGIDNQLASATISTGDDVRDLIIKNKDKMFDFEGDVPNDETWWKEKLVITSPTPDDTEGKVTFNLVLDDSNTIDEPTDSDGIKINETGVVIKGFQVQSSAPTTGEPTTAVTTEVSTVTLGLNGNVAEIKASNEINADWVFNNKHIFFTKGFNLIEAADITNITFEGDLTAQNKKANLSFKVAAGKWFQDDQSLGQAEKAFTIKINGLVADATKNTVLKEKFGKTNAWAISGIDPELSTLTIAQAKTELAKKSFIYKYMKHFLTGDFKLITQESDLFKGDITVTEEGGGILKVEFQIPENKTVATNGQPNTAAVPISFKLKEFASN